MLKLRGAWVVTGAVLATGGMAQAALIAGWNNTPDNWENETHSGNAATQLEYSSTIGVTEGTHSLKLSPRTGFSLLVKNFSFQFNQALLAAGINDNAVLFALDVTIPAGSFDVGGTYFELNMPRVGSDRPFVNTLVNAASVPGGGTQTLYFVIPAGDRGSPNPGFYGLFIGVNTDRAPGLGEVYVDNLRLTPIPEPAGLGLVGGLALGLLRRTRCTV